MGDDNEDEQNVSIGVARYPCMPSLVSLQLMRNRLHLARLGRKLMKWTAMATGREERRVASLLYDLYSDYPDETRNAYLSLARCRYFYPNLNHMVSESVGNKAPITLTTTLKSVAGVKVTQYEILETGINPYSHLGIDKGGQQIEETKKQWRELLLRLIKIEQEREDFLQLEAANKAATKKMNVLSRIVIPRIKLSIAYILSELEEAEREEFFRLKRVKQGKQSKNKRKETKHVCSESCKCFIDEPPEPVQPPCAICKPPEPAQLPPPVQKPCATCGLPQPVEPPPPVKPPCGICGPPQLVQPPSPVTPPCGIRQSSEPVEPSPPVKSPCSTCKPSQPVKQPSAICGSPQSVEPTPPVKPPCGICEPPQLVQPPSPDKLPCAICQSSEPIQPSPPVKPPCSICQSGEPVQPSPPVKPTSAISKSPPVKLPCAICKPPQPDQPPPPVKSPCTICKSAEPVQPSPPVKPPCAISKPPPVKPPRAIDEPSSVKLPCGICKPPQPVQPPPPDKPPCGICESLQPIQPPPPGKSPRLISEPSRPNEPPCLICGTQKEISREKITSVRSSPLPSKVVSQTVPYETQKSESAIDVTELGYFENQFKEIVKVTRRRNPDGTVSEEKKVITIRTEIKNPGASRAANSGICSSSFHGSRSSSNRKSKANLSRSRGTLGINSSCSINTKTTTSGQPCSCSSRKEMATSNSRRRLPKKSSRISCREKASNNYCCMPQVSSLPNFFKTASMQGGCRDVPVQIPIEDKFSQHTCRYIDQEFPTSTTELDETSCSATSKKSSKLLKPDNAKSAESCYKTNDENITVIKIIKKPSPCSICLSRNISPDEDRLTKAIIEAVKKVYSSDKKSNFNSRHHFCDNCMVTFKRIASEVKKSVPICGSSPSYSPFMYSSHCQESSNEQSINSTCETLSCSSVRSVGIEQHNKLNNKRSHIDEPKTSLLSEICCDLPKSRSTRSVCCDTRKSQSNLNYQRISASCSGKESATKNFKKFSDDGIGQIDASTCTKRSDRFDVRTGVRKSPQGNDCQYCKSDSRLMNKSKSKRFLKNSKSLYDDECKYFRHS